MLDQLIIGGKASQDDFGASIASRTIGLPKKKSIKKTVPFSNITHDFSAINGEVYWDERELDYVFEIIADSPEKLEEKKTAFSNWVMNVMNEDIFDPHIPDYHYNGTFDSIAFVDDESVEKTTATVKFLAYPYAISNSQMIYKVAVETGATKTITVVNESAHRIIPTITVDGEACIVYGSSSVIVSSGTYNDAVFMLGIGANIFTVENIGSTDCAVQVVFNEEVF